MERWTTRLLICCLLAFPLAAMAEPIASAGVALTGAPDSCSGVAPRLTAGWARERAPDAPVSPLTRVHLVGRGLPCSGMAILGGGEASLRAGPVITGVGLSVGPAIGLGELAGNADLFVEPSVHAALRIGKVEWTVLRAGIGYGYLDQGWLDFGSSLAVRF